VRVLRRAATQAHAVPQTASHPKGPFSTEVLAKPVVVHEDHDDNPYPFGATAQNDYRGTRMYRCKNCLGVVAEYEVESHTCGGLNGED
jgi:hypothetical protein